LENHLEDVVRETTD
jgi:hypothetical protein